MTKMRIPTLLATFALLLGACGAGGGAVATRGRGTNDRRLRRADRRPSGAPRNHAGDREYEGIQEGGRLDVGGLGAPDLSPWCRFTKLHSRPGTSGVTHSLGDFTRSAIVLLFASRPLWGAFVYLFRRDTHHGGSSFRHYQAHRERQGFRLRGSRRRHRIFLPQLGVRGNALRRAS